MQPLSLGFVSESEYFEIATKVYYEPEEVMAAMNASMPDDIAFYACKETDPKVANLSAKTDAALYRVYVKGRREEYDALDADAFLAQDVITVLKRDKKTKTMVEKDVKSFVYSVIKEGYEGEGYTLMLTLRCASNESLNPVNLLASLYAFNKVDFCLENALIDRIDILVSDGNGNFVSLFDLKTDEAI